MKNVAYSGLFLIGSFMIGCGGGGGGASAIPQKPPLSEDVMNQYGGQKFTYTSPDSTCTSSIILYAGDNAQMTVQDAGPCPVLFKETFALRCADDRACVGRVDKYDSRVTLTLNSDGSVSFNVRNDVEQKDHISTYQLAQ
jgi:hypothetical protein